MQDITTLMKAVDGRNSIMKEITRYNELLDAANKNIKARCTHPTVVERNSYSPGGYDYTSESRTWHECTICGKQFNVTVERGNFQ